MEEQITDSQLSDSTTSFKKLRAKVKRRFQKALTDYQLIQDGDYIMVALSGGKDSLCLLQLLAERSRIFKPQFRVIAVHVRMENIAYESDCTYLQEFAEGLGIELRVLTTRFDASTDKRHSPCFLCSWNRRKQLFQLAQQLGCNKIALGHHMDDIIHTALMNQCFHGHFSTMPVKLKMERMPLTIIRPLALEHEADIKAFADMQGYVKQKKLCPYETDSHRAEVKQIFNMMERMNSETRYSIWNALEADGKLYQAED